MKELNIRNFKLINGDNIIALVSSDNPDNYLVERPISVYSTMIGGYQFSPWFPFSDQKRYSIDKHNIMGSSSVVDSIKKEYIKYALSAQEAFEPPESQETLLNRITDEICNRFEVEDEVYPVDDVPNHKETIH
jgi:hypothetical protein